MLACGLGLLLASLVRGSKTLTIEELATLGNERSLNFLEGVWAPRSIYLNVVTEDCRVNASLYSARRLLKKWSNSRGFISRLSIKDRVWSYLTITSAKPGENCKVFVRASFYGFEKDLLKHASLMMILGIFIYIISIFIEKRKILIAITLIFLYIPGSLTYGIPNWLEPGTYAKYKGRVIFLRWINTTSVEGSWNMYFSWKCLNVTDESATLLVNLTLVDVNSSKTFLSWSGYVEINVETREVYYKGKNMGVTSIYLWPSPSRGRRVKLIKIGNYTIYGNVSGVDAYSTDCCGPQEAIKVNYTFSLTFPVGGVSGSGELYYDIDTGLLLSLSELDPLFLVAGFYILFGPSSLSDTNIDIGPSYAPIMIRYLLIRILFYIMIVSPLIIAIVTYILIRKKGRKSSSKH